MPEKRNADIWNSKTSCNTYISNSTQCFTQPLLYGFDSLYIGYFGNYRQDLIFKNTHELNIEGYRFTIKNQNRGAYGLGLYSSVANIFLENIYQAAASPSMYVQVKSDALTQLGLNESYDVVEKIVAYLCDGEIPQEAISRADYFADFICEEKFAPSHLDNFVTKATTRATYKSGNDFSGFRFGKKNLTARVYDKTLEIRGSKKDYLYKLWSIEKASCPVWRVEFQLRRQSLRKFDVNRYDDLQGSFDSVWGYCTKQWLSLRNFDNQRVTRRTCFDFWKQVQNVHSTDMRSNFNFVRQPVEAVQNNSKGASKF